MEEHKLSFDLRVVKDFLWSKEKKKHKLKPILPTAPGGKSKHNFPFLSKQTLLSTLHFPCVELAPLISLMIILRNWFDAHLLILQILISRNHKRWLSKYDN